jgi:cystathionine beta-lyase family protein involved in aluminum resistance
MTSSPLEPSSNEDKVVMSKIMLGSGLEQVSKAIDSLSSANLKRVLKIVGHVHIAESLLERKSDLELNDAEQTLIEKIFALQETVMGHSTLVQEVETVESGLETVDLSTNIEENINE